MASSIPMSFESLAFFPCFARMSASSNCQGLNTRLGGPWYMLCMFLSPQQEYLLVTQQWSLIFFTQDYLKFT